MISLAVDYTVRYHIDADLGEIMAGLPNLSTDPARPIELTFRNVGVEVDTAGANVQFFYNPADGFQLDINDPGVFRLGDGIGDHGNVGRGLLAGRRDAAHVGTHLFSRRGHRIGFSGGQIGTLGHPIRYAGHFIG